MAPFLSIIIPVFNKVSFVDGCINSILNQSFTDFELILVDDGSTDGSSDKCDGYLDSRIIVRHQQNKGVSAARNAGLSAAKGEYVGFIDADDSIAPDMYKLLIDNALEIDADISVCSIRIIDNEDESFPGADKVPIKYLDKSQTLTALLNGELNWSANNKIYKTPLARKVKFEGRMNEDLLYCFNIINLMTGRACFQNVERYNYLKRDNSVSLSKFDARQMESVHVSKKILDIVKDKCPEHITEARSLDFVSNLSILNLIILSGKSSSAEFSVVVDNLKAYTPFINELSLSRKQQYAFKMIKFSPTIYWYLFKTFCEIFPTEAKKKTL